MPNEREYEAVADEIATFRKMLMTRGVPAATTDKVMLVLLERGWTPGEQTTPAPKPYALQCALVGCDESCVFGKAFCPKHLNGIKPPEAIPEL